jgi:phosphoglycerate kinase
VAHYVPVRVAGLLMARELRVLSTLLSEPHRPFTAIIGGSKVSSKMGVLSNMMKLVDNLVIGGGMVFTFLKAKGYSVGNSLVEDDYLDTAKQLMQDAETQNKVIVLPKDIVVADKFAADAQYQVVPVSQIPDGWMGLDLGPESIERIREILKNTRTVFWNGPLGVFEFPAFAHATRAVADTIAELTASGNLTSILCGGDTQAAIDQFGILPSRYTHVSTGGGATMELLEGLPMPGVSVLEDKATSASRA